MPNDNITAAAGPATLLEAVENRARRDPSGRAFLCLDRRGRGELTWRGLADRVRACAAGWLALGLKPGEPVIILMHNSPDLLAAQLGVMAAGGVAASMDPGQLVRTMRQSFSLLPQRFCLIGDDSQQTAVEFAGLGDIELLVHKDPLPRPAGGTSLTLAELEAKGRAYSGALPAADTNAVAMAAFTMGCTGTPLPVGLSQAALLAAGRGLAAALDLRAGQSYLSLSHLSSSWTMQEFIACLGSGADFALAGWFPGLNALEKAAGRLSPSHIRISHAAFIELFAPYLRAGRYAALRAPLSQRLRASASRLWRAAGGSGSFRALRRALSPVPSLGSAAPSILLSCGTLSKQDAEVMRALGQPVRHTYGLTEACGFLTVGRAGSRDQGKPLPGMAVLPGAGGELLVTGPAVMKGYVKLPPGNIGPRCSVENGTLHTRDFGRLEPGGELVYESSARYQCWLDRGEPVQCDRAAELIMEDPLILRAAVIGGRKNRLDLKSTVAIVAPDPDALRRAFGPAEGHWLGGGRRERLAARLQRRLEALPPAQRPSDFVFTSPHSSAVWTGKLCPDRRPRYAMLQPRDNFDLLYVQLRDSAKQVPPEGCEERRKGEPLFLSVESEFDRPLMRHEEASRDFGFKADKVLGGGIATLLGSLEKAGWDPDYLPYRFQWHKVMEPQVRRLADFLLRRPGRIIAAGGASVVLPFILSALREVCRKDPSRKVVLGGCGPSAAARSIMEHFPFVSAVIMGEAELSMPRVLEALDAGGDLSAIPGVTARAPDGSIVVGVPERIKDLDALPPASYGRIDLRMYHHVSVPTMRGCPNKCKFCGNRAMYGPGVSMRSLEKVMDEIRFLHYEREQNDFFISDDTFTLLKPRVLQFCALMKAEFGRKVNWYCYASVDSLDAERMKAMAESGCRSVFVGVESGSDRLLRLYKGAGGYTAAKALATIAEASKYFASVQSGLIVGFPDETLFDFLQTLRMGARLMKRGGGDVVFHWLKAIPLTPLFENSRGSLIIPPDVSLYRGNREYSRWAKDFARLDPSLAPWAAQIPTPWARLKSFILWRYLRDHWNL